MGSPTQSRGPIIMMMIFAIAVPTAGTSEKDLSLRCGAAHSNRLYRSVFHNCSRFEERCFTDCAHRSFTSGSCRAIIASNLATMVTHPGRLTNCTDHHPRLNIKARYHDCTCIKTTRTDYMKVVLIESCLSTFSYMHACMHACMLGVDFNSPKYSLN